MTDLARMTTQAIRRHPEVEAMLIDGLARGWFASKAIVDALFTIPEMRILSQRLTEDEFATLMGEVSDLLIAN